MLKKSRRHGVRWDDLRRAKAAFEPTNIGELNIDAVKFHAVVLEGVFELLLIKHIDVKTLNTVTTAVFGFIKRNVCKLNALPQRI